MARRSLPAPTSPPTSSSPRTRSSGAPARSWVSLPPRVRSARPCEWRRFPRSASAGSTPRDGPLGNDRSPRRCSSRSTSLRTSAAVARSSTTGTRRKGGLVSGSAGTPHVLLVGDETRRLVEAIRVVADISGQTPTVVGGIAVLCRVHRAYRATSDLDTLSYRDHRSTGDLDTLDRSAARTPSLLELLRASPGAEAVEPAAANVVTPSGPVRVDVIDVPGSPDIEDPTDRLYEMAHAWAFRTATELRIDVLGSDGQSPVSAVARVAEPGPLVAMKLQAVLLRSTAKEGTDLLDIVTILLDPVARDVALTQLAGCDPVIAADAALHAHRWFVEQVDRTLRLIRAAGGLEIGRDEIALVAALLEAATRRE